MTDGVAGRMMDDPEDGHMTDDPEDGHMTDGVADGHMTDGGADDLDAAAEVTVADMGTQQPVLLLLLQHYIQHARSSQWKQHPPKLSLQVHQLLGQAPSRYYLAPIGPQRFHHPPRANYTLQQAPAT